MHIYRNVFNEIINTPLETPQEIGGIIGGNEGIVTKYYMDYGMCSEKACRYIPNVSLLNSVIAEWADEGTQFMGIYHTHFFDVQTLSDGDIQYIKKILLGMPTYIDSLYFPLLVLPKRTMVCFKAIKNSGSVEIHNDSLILI